MIGLMYFMAGVFMFIAMGVYTGSLNKYSHDTGSPLLWPGSWGLGWAGASFEVFAGFLYFIFYCLVGCRSEDKTCSDENTTRDSGFNETPRLMGMAQKEIKRVEQNSAVIVKVDPELIGSTTPSLMTMAQNEIDWVRQGTNTRNQKVAEDYQLEPVTPLH